MIKAKCRCGHKVAVPDEHAGRRVKCPKCGGAITVPVGEQVLVATLVDEPAPAAASAPPRAHSPRSRRHQFERRRKTHNMHLYVALACLFAVVMTVVIILLVNYEPDAGAPIASSNNQQAKKRPDDDAKRINGNMGADDGHTFARGNETPIEMVSAFDADSNTTVYHSAPSPVLVGQRQLQMTIEAVQAGPSSESGPLQAVRLRLEGDMTGLIAGANINDPLMVLEVSGREYAHHPARIDESDARKDENGPEVLPSWVEYDLDSTAITALPKAASIRMKLNDEEAELTPNQVTMLKSLVAAPRATDE